jgi:hypothetical protein
MLNETKARFTRGCTLRRKRHDSEQHKNDGDNEREKTVLHANHTP